MQEADAGGQKWRQAVELERSGVLVEPVLFLKGHHDDDEFPGAARQAVEDLPPILEMLERVRAIYDVGELGGRAYGVDIDELERRVKGARQAEADLRNVAAADR